MDDYKDIKKMLTPSCDFHASRDLHKRVSEEIGRRRKKRLRTQWIWAAVSTCAAAAVLVLIFLPTHISAKEVLAEAISALTDNQSIEMTAEIRTRPMENFKYINPDDDFVSHRIIISERNSILRWRVDKGNRVAVGIGGNSYSWIDTLNLGWRFQNTDPENLLGYLAVLLNPENILKKELQECTDGTGSSYSVTKKGNEIILIVKAEPKGDFSNPYMLNTSVYDSKSIRRYVFDSGTKHLKRASVSVLDGKKEREILRISNINYNAHLQGRFTIPDNIHFVNVADDEANQGLSAMTAVEAASAVLNAFNKWDESIINKAMDANTANILYKEDLIGSELKSVGNSFRSGSDDNTFVPYVLTLRNGREKIHNLVLRQTRSGNWIVVGGL